MASKLKGLGFILRNSLLYKLSGQLKRRLIFFVFLLPMFTHAQEVVRITTGEWPPYFSKQLPHNGFMARIISESFAMENITVEWHFFPWSRAMLYAQRAKSEGTAIWRYSDKRAKHFVYSDPIIRSGNVFFHRKDSNFDWNTYEDLKGLTVGTTSSYLYSEEFHQAASIGIFKTNSIPSEELNFKKLIRGKIDVLPSNKYVGNHILKFKFSKADAAQITYHHKFLKSTELHLLFSRMTGNSKFFSARFNAGLKKLKQSGKFHQYIQQSLSVR